MIVNIMPQFGASLTDDPGVIIYDCNVFIKQAIVLITEHQGLLSLLRVAIVIKVP
jgi:hypothetical protein